MRVATKIALGSCLAVVPLVGLLGYQVTQIERLSAANRDLSAIQFRAAIGSLELIRGLDQLEEYRSKYVVSHDAGYTAKFSEVYQAILEQVASLKMLPLSNSETTHLNAFSTGLKSFYGDGDLSALIVPGGKIERLREMTHAFVAATRRAIVSHTTAAAATSQRAERLSVMVGGLALVVAIIVLLVTARAIHRPLIRLIAGTRAVAKGDFSFRINASGKDEFAELGHAFDRMVQELEQLDEIKIEFVSHVSHELKTPLVAMLETNRFLLDKIPGPLTAQQERMLNLNVDSVNRLCAMIAELLDVSQMKAGLQYQWKQQDIVQIVRRVLDQVAARIQGKQIRFEYLPVVPSLTLWCDGDRMTQVFLNLLDNAIKHTPTEGDLTVLVEPTTKKDVEAHPDLSNTFARIHITDSGPGIPDDEKDLVFSKFYRAKRIRGMGTGVGLGLAICREIINAHGGSIRVCDNPSGGSTFSVVLPYAPPGQLSKADSSSGLRMAPVEECA